MNDFVSWTQMKNISIKSWALEKEYYNNKHNDYYNLETICVAMNKPQNTQRFQKNKDNKAKKKIRGKWPLQKVIYYKDFFATKEPWQIF